MNNEDPGIPTPVVTLKPVARLLRAVPSQEPWDDFSSTSSTLDSYADWVSKGFPAGAKILVCVEDVVLDSSLQVRKQTSQSTVKRYAESMGEGCTFPPVTLASVDGVLLLLDGWHRIAAKQSLGENSTEAVVTQMTYDEARWAAAKANLEHGLPLAASEVVNVFHVFIEAREYRRGYTWLSYREIGTLLGKSHTTIRYWMEKYYPRLFKKYQARATNKDQAKAWDGTPGRKAEAVTPAFSEVVQEVQVSMGNARNIAGALDENTRGVLIESLRNTLRDLESLPYALPIEPDF